MIGYKKPKRFFEDAGIVDPGSAYHVEMENVSNTKGQDIKSMVDLGRYFSIFAPRQSGKTTFFEGVCKHLANDPAYIPFLLSFQWTHPGIYDFFRALNRLIKSKKIVIFIDEFDGIPRSELENFLTTLRELYQEYKGREDKALYSVGLVGIRNITKLIVGGVSPFNIADQVKLPPFTIKNIRDLYGQYTEETNQPFTEGAVGKIYNVQKSGGKITSRI